MTKIGTHFAFTSLLLIKFYLFRNSKLFSKRRIFEDAAFIPPTGRSILQHFRERERGHSLLERDGMN